MWREKERKGRGLQSLVIGTFILAVVLSMRDTVNSPGEGATTQLIIVIVGSTGISLSLLIRRRPWLITPMLFCER